MSKEELKKMEQAEYCPNCDEVLTPQNPETICDECGLEMCLACGNEDDDGCNVCDECL